MTDKQWERLQAVIGGRDAEKARPAGFVIDCPWVPNWYGVKILDYFTSQEIWLESNLKAAADFPDAMFLPGFWSEFGMCTEPSAFGARCAFPLNEFPHAHRVIESMDDIDSLPSPDPRTDGLLPFVLNRLKLACPRIEAAGHRIRFAVSRGPLNIASYLMGSTEFLTAMMMFPDKAHALLGKIVSFMADWIAVQREAFPSIEGVFLLDDIIGFLGEAEFKEFALPYFRKLFTPDIKVRFLHNDAPCRVSAPYLSEMGVNLFNMGFDVSLPELRSLAGDEVVFLGNIPPRDVLAAKGPAEVAVAARELVAATKGDKKIIYSCGGGMPPKVSSENVRAFLDAVRE
jgi:uroporphyrinogen-III decarboxylase